MSTISGVSGTSDPWAAMKAQRSQMQAKMFAKTDANGDGGVDKSELQTIFTDMAKKAGGTVASSDVAQAFTQMDGNSDGKLSSDELSKGMQSLMPEPSTLAFAQSHRPEGAKSSGTSGSALDAVFSKIDGNGDGSLDKSELKTLSDKIKADTGVDVSAKLEKLADDNGGKVSKEAFQAALKKEAPADKGPGGPPPSGGGPPGAGGAGKTDSASKTYDKLDTNQDGTVSELERLVGAMKDAAKTAKADNSNPAQTLFKAIDTDSNGKISSSESDTFIKQLTEQAAKAGSSASTSSETASKQNFDLSKLAKMMYDQIASGLSQQSSSSSVSVMA